MPSSPVVEWRNATTPFAVVSSVALTGTGYSGAIPAGTTSNPVTLRIYNNFAAASSIADAMSCVLAAYDDATHQGIATTVPSMQTYVQVLVTDYNGNTANADSIFYAIGGQTKHPLPVNAGTIGGTGSNYVTIQVEIVSPPTATQGAVSQGLWIEYSSTS